MGNKVFIAIPSSLTRRDFLFIISLVHKKRSKGGLVIQGVEKGRLYQIYRDPIVGRCIPGMLYPKVSDERLKIWKAWLPDGFEGPGPTPWVSHDELFDQFEDKNITVPPAIKDAIAVSKDFFDYYVVRHSTGWAFEEVMVMGVNEKDNFDEQYIARWGEKLLGFDEIKKAVEKSEYRTNLFKKRLFSVRIEFIIAIGMIGFLSSFFGLLSAITGIGNVKMYAVHYGISVIMLVVSCFSKLISHYMHPWHLLEKYRWKMGVAHKPPQ